MLKKIIEKYKSGAFREMWNETKWLYSYAAKYRWLRWHSMCFSAFPALPFPP